MQVYTTMHTCMLLGAAVHWRLFTDGECFVYPPAGVAKKDAKIGVKPEPVNMLYMLDSSTVALSDIMANPDVVALDSKCYKLKMSISHCTLWASQLKAFLDGAKLHLVTSASAELMEMSASLEAAVPRFDFVFSPPGSFHRDLAVERVLNHPRRGAITPMAKSVAQTLDRLSVVAHSWNMSAQIAGVSSFSGATVQTAEHFLCVAAAINCVQVQTGPKQGGMAGEILSIAQKHETRNPECKLPDILLTMLKAVAAKQDVQAGAPGAASSTSSDCARPLSDQQPAAKRARVVKI